MICPLYHNEIQIIGIQHPEYEHASAGFHAGKRNHKLRYDYLKKIFYGTQILKQMPRAPSFTIKIHSISNIDPFYCQAQVRMRGFEQKVIVIGHQAIGKHLDRLSLHCLP